MISLSRDDLLTKVAEFAQKDSYGQAEFNNIESLTFDDIRAASQAAKRDGKKIHLCFDTVVNKDIKARLLMNPSLLEPSLDSGEIKLGVDVSDKTNKSVRDKFEKQFGQAVAVMKTEQTDSFGMPVVIAGRIDLGSMDKDKLCVYVYDYGLNRHYQITDPRCTADDSGFVFLTCDRGGYIIITNYNGMALK